MKLYEVGGASWENELTFFPMKSAAIKFAKEDGNPEDDYVLEIEQVDQSGCLSARQRARLRKIATADLAD